MMRIFNRGSVVPLTRVHAATLALAFGLFAGACGHSTPVGPTASAATTILSITGQVTDLTTAAPISGATVTLAYPTTRAVTDSNGSYALILPPPPSINYASTGLVWISANNYERDYRYYRAATLNFHLYPIIRIAAGDSTSVTVTPTDTMCINNVQDTPPWDQVCRSVRVVPATDGIMTLEAFPAIGAARPGLEVETVVDGSGLLLTNPASLAIAAGTEVIANIEMPASSVTSQSFTLITSMVRP
jgi:hypothetical protein